LFYPIPQARQQVLKYPYLPGADISDGAVTAAAVTALLLSCERGLPRNGSGAQSRLPKQGWFEL
jgi:hypothetical protein